MVVENLPDRTRSRAILIGTADYERSESLPNLPAVGNNLLDLRRVLTDSDTGILDLSSCTVVDSPDSPASLVGRLRRVARQAEDLLLVYYAGHGIRHDSKDVLYLAVRDTTVDNLGTTAVPFELVREVIEESSARTRVLILDCCYSGMAIGTMATAAVDPREIRISGTSVLTSVPKNKKALSPPGERHTAYTGELISLLENGPRVGAGPLTVSSLHRSLQAAMSNRGLPVPKFVSADTSGELVLRRSPPRIVPAVVPPVVVDPVPVPEPVVAALPVTAEPVPSGLFDATTPRPPASVEPTQPATRPWAPSEVPPDAGGPTARVKVGPGYYLNRIVPLYPLLLVLTAISIDILIVAGADFIFTEKPTTGAGQVSVVFLGISALLVFVTIRVRKWRAEVREPDSTGAAGKALTAVHHVQSVVLGLVCLFCGIMVLAGIGVSLSPPSGGKPTSLYSTLSLMLIMCEGAAGSGWALFRRSGKRRVARR